MSHHDATEPPGSEPGFGLLAPWLGGSAAVLVQSGVCFETGLRRCLGRANLYDRIARRFLETRVGEARALQAALGCGDLDTVRKLTHDMASTAGTLGAGGLSATALALQAAVDAGADAQALAQLARLFSSEHAVVLDRLASYARGDVDIQALAPRKS